MLDIVKRDDKRVDLVLDGKLDEAGMRKGLDELLAATEGMKNGVMLYTIRNFQLPTLAAIGMEMRYMPRLFSLIGRFDRVAVLCDEDWMRMAGKIEGALIPSLDIKCFELHETAKAEAFLANDR